MSVQSALYQWQQGERRVRAAPPARHALLERVVAAIVSELRRRLGGRFLASELVELYEGGTEWCVAIATRVAPQEPWAWEPGVVVDGAFARYLREASDYAGGRVEAKT